MAELADALALGASGRKAVQVQVLFSAPPIALAAPSFRSHSLAAPESGAGRGADQLRAACRRVRAIRRGQTGRNACGLI
jgi:hypothetical protein